MGLFDGRGVRCSIQGFAVKKHWFGMFACSIPDCRKSRRGPEGAHFAPAHVEVVPGFRTTQPVLILHVPLKNLYQCVAKQVALAMITLRATAFTAAADDGGQLFNALSETPSQMDEPGLLMKLAFSFMHIDPEVPRLRQVKLAFSPASIRTCSCVSHPTALWAHHRILILLTDYMLRCFLGQPSGSGKRACRNRAAASAGNPGQAAQAGLCGFGCPPALQPEHPGRFRPWRFGGGRRL